MKRLFRPLPKPSAFHLLPLALTLACGAVDSAFAQTATAAGTATNAAVSPLKLRGITFVNMEDASAPRVPHEGIDLAQVPVLDTPEVRSQLRSLLDGPLSQESLIGLIGIANARFAAVGQSFTVASIPQQDVSNGLLLVEVRRARVGNVAVKRAGAQAFPEEHYRNLLRLRPGDLLVRDTLDEEADWISRANPYRSASVVTQPGQVPGTTDLELVVTDRRPYAFSAGYDNSGTRVTGRDRLNFSAGWGNVFGLDQQLNYSLSVSPDFHDSVAHTLGYVVPLPWRHLLSVTASHSTLHGRMPAPFDLNGGAQGVSVRYDVPLKTHDGFKHGFYGSFDYKRSDNNLLFSAMPVNNTLTDIYQVGLGYSFTLRDKYGSTSVGLNWFHSPGSVGGVNNDGAFNAARAGAKSRYNYQTLTVERLTRLPADWSWTINGRYQRSDGNLLGSEQLAGGGVSSVRGFADPVVYGDEGFVIRNELAAPALPLGDKGGFGALQGILFYDAARLWSHTLLPGEQSAYNLSSWGVGVRANFARNVALRADFGKQLKMDVPGANPDNIAHVSINISF
ncbi:MAG TPA: ShlB/FhaC/HecB family hemolysin secretion/activation protein [Burkholderiaceae bacterium]|nr:ShlB/FhaC/HecB family hemolysin secretion/activation protein [Burkholderiaceae bacterium]